MLAILSEENHPCVSLHDECKSHGVEPFEVFLEMTLLQFFLQVRFSEELHVSADAASRLFIIIGICTFIGRLLSGLICNMRHINPVYVYFIGLILDGSDVVFLSQAKTYGHLIAFSFLYGLADGLLVGTFYITILNSVEVPQKASAFGLSALCYGTTVATGPALAGTC